MCGYELEQDEDAIEDIAKREFQGNEFKAGYKQGKFMFYGHSRKKDLKQHFKRLKEIME